MTMDRAKVCVLFLGLLVLEPYSCTTITSDFITEQPSTDLVTDHPSTALITEQSSTDLITEQPSTDLELLKSQVDQLTKTISAERDDRAQLEGQLIQLRVNLTAELSFERENMVRLEEELHRLRSDSMVEISAERGHRIRLEQDILHLITNQSSTQDQVVAFSAWVTHDLEHLQTNDVIVFGTVITNLGGAYNGGSGKFRCPISGVYQFYVGIQSRKTEYIHTELMVNGEPRMYLYSSGDKENSGSIGSNTIILELRADDLVWVKFQKSNGHFIDGGFSTFSGHLLHII